MRQTQEIQNGIVRTSIPQHNELSTTVNTQNFYIQTNKNIIHTIPLPNS